MKKYLLALLLIGAVAGLTVAPVVLAKNENGKGPGWQMMSRPEVLGTVTAVSGNTISVKDLRGNTGTIYTVDATNATVIKNGQTSTVSAIAVNDTISVQGVVNGTTITATKINDRVFGNKEKDKLKEKFENEKNLNNPMIIGDGSPIIAGTVATVSGNTITLKNKSNVVYTIDATNAKVQTNGNAAGTVSNIAVGDNVIVQGTINGTSVTASLIIDQKPKPASQINNPNNNQNENKPKPRGFWGGIGNWFKNLFGF